VDEADPIHLAASFAEHDLKYYVLDREEACLSCFVCAYIFSITSIVNAFLFLVGLFIFKQVYIACCDYSHWWVIFVDIHFRKFRVSSSLKLTESQMASTERIVWFSLQSSYLNNYLHMTTITFIF
jgi:hypothetical protein